MSIESGSDPGLPEPRPYQKNSKKSRTTRENKKNKKLPVSANSHDKAADAVKKLRKEQKYMPVTDHLEELRWMLIRSIAWVVLFSIVASFFYNTVWDFIMEPVIRLISESKDKNIIVKIITTRLSDHFIIQLKLIVISGVLMGLPAIIIEIWRYILPALGKKFSRWGFLFIFSAILSFWGGAALVRLYLWPQMVHFLVFDWMPPGILHENILYNSEVHLTLNEYISFFFTFHFIFGAVFELPIISIILAAAGLINSSLFTKHWRGIIIGSSIGSAILTPPDILSMMFMMLPVIALFVVSGFLVFIFERRKKEDESDS